MLRAILSYFMNYPLEELPYVRVPLHTVIKLTPQAYGTKMEEYVAGKLLPLHSRQPSSPKSGASWVVVAACRFPLDIEAVDTHRDPRKKH